jgi:glycosyltransferase involved in cell wall biosynthesis
MPLPRVSVVIPCFNAQRYIGATLRSVLAQEGVSLEVVVVDDGSSDGSAQQVAQDFPQVKLLRVPNGGVARARNRGIEAATGDWIAFVDADDIWLPGKLQAQLDEQAAWADCRMSYTAWKVWFSDSPEPEADVLQELARTAGELKRWEGASGWIYPELLLDCEVWTSTVLVRRDVLQEIGGFNPDLRIGEDYDLWLRASRVTRIQRIARPYALYRQHPGNITRGAQTANYKGQVVQSALDRWGFAGPDGRAMDARAVQRMLAKTWSDFAAAQLMAGQRAAARTSIYEALRRQFNHLPGWKLLIRSLLPLTRRP